MDGFSMRISLKPVSLTGLQAVDWRRSRGLAEGNRLYTDPTRVYFTVEDESFIRLWFGPKDTCVEAFIQLDWLHHHELIMHENNECVGILASLPPERVQALFVRARFATLQAELDDAEIRLAAAQALLDKEDEAD